MSATEELRRLLDERGVEWRDSSNENVLHTTWNNMNCWFIEFQDGWTAWGMSMHGTPEQAIAATLGEVRAGSSRFELTAEQVRELIEHNSYHVSGNMREFFNGAYEEIADELNAALGGGDCEFVIEDNMNETEGMGDVWFRCTNCGTTFDYYADDWLMKQNYCPHCGFKIRKAVER